MSITALPAWNNLQQHAAAISQQHLKELLKDGRRCRGMMAEHNGIVLDFARQNANGTTTKLLLELAKACGLKRRISAMVKGKHINVTEDRAVLHTALRAPAEAAITVDGQDISGDVHQVLKQINQFSNKVRKGSFRGATGKALTNVVAIGIGGSYLGPEFVYEALACEKKAAKAAEGRQLRFLANVDPIDVSRAFTGLDPETTLIIVISKTFTTAETMMNARTARDWLVNALGTDAIAKHFVAVSTNLPAVAAFGINPKNAFAFWDWVGGRYSVCSAVGMLPLSLHFGYPIMKQFLAGAHDLDQHFTSAPLAKNLPVLLGLYGIWNSSFLGHHTRALLPYCQALHKFAAHIQQVDMESNGKRVDLDGQPLGFEAGEIDFGEPGTNGQHSFYQLVHQGRVVPADFIGFTASQTPMTSTGSVVSNHDELMANFFAQPDALACGKSAAEVAADGIAEDIVPHKVFPGNRPSNVLLFDGQLDAFRAGQLLALYEHRTAVQGFIWNLNSFDQMGVELGKVLAGQVRSQLRGSRTEAAEISGFNPSTTRLMARYLGQ